MPRPQRRLLNRPVRPPGPPLWRAPWTYPEFADDLLGFLLRMQREHGDIGYMRLGPLQIYFLNHPDLFEEVLLKQHRIMHKDPVTKGLSLLMGQGLVTSEGELWRRQRKLAAPALSRRQIAAYGAGIVEHAAALFDRWQEGERIDVGATLSTLTLDVVVKTLFGADFGVDARKVGEATVLSLEVLTSMSQSAWRFFPPSFAKRFNPRMRELNAAVAEIDAVLMQIIRDRRAEEAAGADLRERSDLLSRLLSARYEDGGRISDPQLRDEVITFFLAGHETTALGLTYCLHLLSHHPEELEQAIDEVDRVLEGRPARVEDMPALRRVEAVVKESLRIYPPIWSVGREAIEPFELAGYEIPAGANFFVPQWVMHKDPRFFPEPARFLPSRWLDGSTEGLPRFAYFPFGGGPRVCIGDRFAMMELILVLTTLLQRARLRALGPREIALTPTVTLRPVKPIHMRVERR